MTVITLPLAERDLEETFDHYEAQRAGLGEEFLVEFRRAVDRILTHPNASQKMDDLHRRCRLHRFPYGVMYHIDETQQEIVISAVIHMHRKPQDWYR
jgi:plasmid stabilization system protein ParE